MSIPRLNRIMLLTEGLLNSDTLEECCDSIAFVTNGDIAWQSQKESIGNNIGKNLYVIKNVPEYLDINFYEDKNIYSRKYRSITGFAMSLAKYDDIDSYMRDQFKSKARSQLFRRIRRLEKCFNITHKRFYGQIDKIECLTLLASLKEMIITRFQERNQVSDSLKYWKEIQTHLPSLIRAKKASLFVIYNEDVPISISICYHYGNVFFSYIDSYDTNYFKFGLGNIMIFKKLKICIENNYDFFDMGWGELDYKRRWCNYIYDYEHHILIPNNNLPSYIIAFWEGNKTRFKSYLLSSKLNLMVKKIKYLIKPTANHTKNTIRYHFEDLENSTSYSNLIPINPSNERNINFKTILNDFIYTTEEYYLNVKLYNSQNEGVYIIKGKTHSKKIVFNT